MYRRATLPSSDKMISQANGAADSTKYHSEVDAKRILEELSALSAIIDETSDVSAGLKRVLNLNLIIKRQDHKSISDTELSLTRLSIDLKKFLDLHQYDSGDLSLLLKGFDLYTLESSIGNYNMFLNSMYAGTEVAFEQLQSSRDGLVVVNEMFKSWISNVRTRISIKREELKSRL